jgi:hypothetical protein
MIDWSDTSNDTKSCENFLVNELFIPLYEFIVISTNNHGKNHIKKIPC